MVAIIISWILIIILSGIVTMALVYDRMLSDCNNDVNPWCYEDWYCLDKETGEPRRMDTLKERMARCTPIDEERVKELNQRGCVNFYRTDWTDPGCIPGDDGDICRAVDNSRCPKYEVGDIDWTKSTGCAAPDTYHRY